MSDTIQPSKKFILINIVHRIHTNLQCYHSAHKTQNKNPKNMHSGGHFGIAAVSTTDVLVPFETPLSNVILSMTENR